MDVNTHTQSKANKKVPTKTHIYSYQTYSYSNTINDLCIHFAHTSIRKKLFIRSKLARNVFNHLMLTILISIYLFHFLGCLRRHHVRHAINQYHRMSMSCEQHHSKINSHQINQNQFNLYFI